MAPLAAGKPLKPDSERLSTLNGASGIVNENADVLSRPAAFGSPFRTSFVFGPLKAESGAFSEKSGFLEARSL